MADFDPQNNSIKAQAGLVRELNALYKQQKGYLDEMEKSAKAGNILAQQGLTALKEEVKLIDRELKTEQKKLKAEREGYKEYRSFVNEFKRLSPAVKEQLKSTSKAAGVYADLAQEAGRQAEIEERTSGIVSQNAKERKEALQAAKNSLNQSAQNAAQQRDELLGINEFERRRLDLEAQRSILGNNVVDRLIEANNQQAELTKKTEILQDLNDALPGPIQDMLGFARGLRGAFTAGMAPMFLIAGIALAVLSSFTKLDESAKEFRTTTGLTNSQMEGIKSQANDITGEFATMGVDAGKVFDTVAALKSEFSDIANFSDEVVAGLTLMNTNFGISADKAAEVQGIFEQIGGLSSETATSVGMQVAEMANIAGVAPSKIFEDIAENAEIASTYFQGDVESLARAAIEARRLGTNLKSIATTTEHLLDFQSSIGDELVAATFVGGQFNLTQARSLAAAGKTVEAQKEVLRQLQRGGDFRKKDYFTQQQLAKAAGMSVEEINKQLNAQEKLNSLSSDQRKLAEEAISQGLDISDINKDQLASQVQQFSKQKEMKGQVEALGTAFSGIAATIGSSLTPLLEGLIPILHYLLLPVQAIATGFGMVVNFVKENIPLMATLGTLAGVFYAKAIAGAVASIWRSIVGFLGPFGIPVAIAASLGAVSMAKNAMSTADDVMGVPSGYGNTMVTTAGKGTIALNNNDSFIAGTNLGGGGGGITAAQAERLIAGVEKQRETYLDGRRVTSNISRVVDSSGKNNFAQGFS